MRIAIACLAGVITLAALVLSGAIAAADLSHPFWQIRASLTGGLIGALFGGGLIWITGTSDHHARTFAIALGLALLATLYVTWSAARMFIDSANYEPAAGQMWFIGYHIVCALIVAVVALLVIAITRADQGRA